MAPKEGGYCRDAGLSEASDFMAVILAALHYRSGWKFNHLLHRAEPYYHAAYIGKGQKDPYSDL